MIKKNYGPIYTKVSKKVLENLNLIKNKNILIHNGGRNNSSCFNMSNKDGDINIIQGVAYDIFH